MSAAKHIRVRIAGSGPNPENWTVTDTATGLPVIGVRSVDVRADVFGKIEARITVIDFDFDMLVEADATPEKTSD